MNKQAIATICVLCVPIGAANAQQPGEQYQQQQQSIISLENEVRVLELTIKKAELVGIGGEITSLPVLTGIVTGANGKVIAEFRQGRALIRAQEGDTINGFWRIKKANPTGVVLESKDGKQTRGVSFGVPERPNSAYISPGMPALMQAAAIPVPAGE